MRAGIVAVALAGLCGPWAAPEVRGQVLKDLAPVDLEYTLFHGDPAKKVGTARIAFKPIDTPRGRRLEVRARIEYTIQRATPFAYEEEATLLCDGEGVARFDTIVRALGDERVNTGIRMGGDYQVTSTFRGKKTSKTITAGVQRTNYGLFAAGFLPQSLEGDELFRDYPMLFPAAANHMPRQKFNEGVLPFVVGPDKQVPAVVTRLDKPNKTSDRLWNAASGHGILLRMEEKSSLGLITYELAAVNGVPPAQSQLVR
jgi:hypothetical protein